MIFVIELYIFEVSEKEIHNPTHTLEYSKNRN